eukprot:gene27521-31105_t
MWLAPLPAVLSAKRNGDLGELNPFPWVAAYLTCVAFVAYSVLLKNYFIWFANAFGFAAGVAFVGENDERERAAAVIGNTAMCFNILYYFAPLSSALTVVRTMNSASLYAPLLALNLANALLWMCYGLAIGDVIVITPNVLGTIVSGGLLVLSFLIPKREKVPDEPKENFAFDEVSAPQSNPMFDTVPVPEETTLYTM